MYKYDIGNKVDDENEPLGMRNNSWTHKFELGNKAQNANINNRKNFFTSKNFHNKTKNKLQELIRYRVAL